MSYDVVSLCSMNAIELEPWARAGCRCLAVDIQNEQKRLRFEDTQGSIEWVNWDIFDMNPRFMFKTHFAFAFPPCTDLAGSGARWWESKGQKALDDAIALVQRCWDLASRADAWVLENPVGRLSTHWRRPDHYFNPCDYGGYIEGGGDRYTKKTCLWTGGKFKMPEPKPVEPIEGSKMWAKYGGKSERTKNERSKTPLGWSLAIFNANLE